MLHDSSGVDESAQMRERVKKKPRVDDDMEITTIETLTNDKLEVDRALSKQDVASCAGRMPS